MAHEYFDFLPPYAIFNAHGVMPSLQNEILPPGTYDCGRQITGDENGTLISEQPCYPVITPVFGEDGIFSVDLSCYPPPLHECVLQMVTKALDELGQGLGVNDEDNTD